MDFTVHLAMPQNAVVMILPKNWPGQRDDRSW